MHKKDIIKSKWTKAIRKTKIWF